MDSVDLDVDNLFNDGNLDQILPTADALQPPVLVPGLSERFLDLQFCGGSNRVAWSRQGHIAVISSDGSTVGIHCLRSGIRTKEWKLSSSRSIEATFEDVVNVTWSPSGVDLAIVDSRGRVAIYSMTTVCLNRLNESKSALADPPNELGAPIGTWWLNQDRQDRPRTIVTHAKKNGTKWSHEMTKARTLGPLYPRAFCTISRQGTFILTYQRPGARYTRTSVELPSLSDTICSHAAFSPTSEGKILVVVHSLGGNLSVYHIQINWPPDLMTDPNSNTHPDLIVDVIDSCVSMWSEFDTSNTASLTQSYKPDGMVLTHLMIVPVSDIETAVTEPPTIWAVYTLMDPAISAGDAGFLSTSTIRRWSVYPLVQSLHPQFDNIPGKTEASAGDEDVFEVERLSDLVFPQTVTSLELVEPGQMMAISTADGRTELWNPTTQTPVTFEGQPDEVRSMAQFGFSFNPVVNAIMTTLSPNACSSLTMNVDQKPSIHQIQYPLQPTAQDLDLSDSNQSASIASLVLAFARSCWSNSNGDDVLSCILANYSPDQYPVIVSEFYRTLFRDTEFIHEKAPKSEVERLVSKQIVGKVLSFQIGLQNSHAVSLTSPNETVRYSALAGVWAWLAINLRYTATKLYIFYKEHQTSAQSNAYQANGQLNSTSYIDAICSTVHWTLDLYRFIIATILEIGDRQTNPDFFCPLTFNNNLGDTAGDGSQGLVALLLNCQWTRSFLSAIARAMHAFIESKDRGHSPAIGRVVNTIRRYSVGRGMNISAIDKLLEGRWYVRNGLREGEEMDAAIIAKRQMTMCSTGKVGTEYSGTLKMLLENVINNPENGIRAKGDIERMKLWCETPDLDWILLGFNQHFSAEADRRLDFVVDGDEPTGKKFYDVHRKSTITVTGAPDQMIRRCVRCGSLSGDIEGADKSWSRNMFGYLARCVCDAYWILEPLRASDDG